MNFKKPIFVRRVVGDSMSPKLAADKLLIATTMFHDLHPGHVVIVLHDGKQKVKRIERMQGNKVFVVGDNLAASTDSRHFGWLDYDHVVARVVWPKLTK